MTLQRLQRIIAVTGFHLWQIIAKSGTFQILHLQERHIGKVFSRFDLRLKFFGYRFKVVSIFHLFEDPKLPFMASGWIAGGFLMLRGRLVLSSYELALIVYSGIVTLVVWELFHKILCQKR